MEMGTETERERGQELTGTVIERRWERRLENPPQHQDK